MIDRSHSPISSLDGQDQALYTGRGGHLGFLCTEGGGGIAVYTRTVPGHLSTHTGSKMAVHNTKRSIKTIIRKIKDCQTVYFTIIIHEVWSSIDSIIGKKKK